MYRNLSLGALRIQASLEEAVRLARLGGFGGVDVDAQEVAELVWERSAEYVRDLLGELRAGGIGLPVDWKGGEGEYREGLKRLREALGPLRDVGCDRAYTWVPSWSDERPFRENFRWHIERLRPAAEVLGEFGFRLGLEFLGPRTLREGKRYAFLHTMDGMLALCAAVGENVGLLLDSWHWYTSHGTVFELEELEGDQVVYAHINDAPEGVEDRVRWAGDAGAFQREAMFDVP
ncbi:MAG TPA: sugar phosphate isomerase/epimerase [Candidatus Latescibacteria bacterium]|nr:sugar phosphate isomerase/epimerase [Candidatus Latescibacterota bacterium]